MAISTFPLRLAASAAIATAAPIAAQTLPSLDGYSLPPGQSTPSPTPTPTTTPTVVPIPAAPTIVLPTPTPSPGPAARRAPPEARETPTSVPRAAGAQPAPAAVPPAPAAPIATATPAPRPTPAPTPAAPASPTAAVSVEGRDGQGTDWWWIGGLAALAVVAMLAFVRARRPRSQAIEVVEDVEATGVITPPPPLASMPNEPATRARLGLMLRPTRAGFNMLSATVEAELTVVNTGDAPATDIRIALALLSAHAEQGAEIADHHSRPIARPVVPAFALAPGETRVARVVVALPRDSIKPLTASSRPMFVPVVAANCRYTSEGKNGQAVQSFVVGIERDDAAKLAPFWLDQPAKMYDRVAARPNAVAGAG